VGPETSNGQKAVQCSAAGKVTASLASHWPCVTNSNIRPPIWIDGLRKGEKHSAYAPTGMEVLYPLQDPISSEIVVCVYLVHSPGTVCRPVSLTDINEFKTNAGVRGRCVAAPCKFHSDIKLWRGSSQQQGSKFVNFKANIDRRISKTYCFSSCEFHPEKYI